mmetsp:Transcript_22891/g.56715  ORF Transcript_22891/g.56715 Transcript_22891/m.56715 type:complete len:209 (-) Transcript_22891:640-1266(-)
MIRTATRRTWCNPSSSTRCLPAFWTSSMATRPRRPRPRPRPRSRPRQRPKRRRRRREWRLRRGATWADLTTRRLPSCRSIRGRWRCRRGLTTRTGKGPGLGPGPGRCCTPRCTSSPWKSPPRMRSAWRRCWRSWCACTAPVRWRHTCTSRPGSTSRTGQRRSSLPSMRSSLCLPSGPTPRSRGCPGSRPTPRATRRANWRTRARASFP